ncbi:nuclear pore complex protein Nup153 isoform X2 [Wyeomyia smithii]|uniref:nuclear pore complex protein Nup153 isoform X2 n=1 Tax=Wyeomyia smithii TaxID=174621 RepID=UPI002467BD70|nr:nuclear pore complex protein Nup153 isoform X2 [Wyeomyia smithii]
MFQARSRANRSSEDHPSQSPSSMAAAGATTMASGTAAALNISAASSGHNDSSNLLDDDPNSSIIKKVRSRVSSILPDAISKWFSPVASKRPRDTDTASGSNSTPTTSGRNGNLLRYQQSSGGEGSPLLQQQHHSPAQDEEDDEDHAPPIRKRTRLDDEFNTSEADITVDFGAQPGPSGLNISAIDRRGSLPACAQLPRSGLRNIFTSSTPSTSPQNAAGSLQQKTSMLGYSNRTAAFDFGSVVAEPSTSGGNPMPTTDELHNESLTTLIRHRKSIREVSQRKRLNIPPMAVDRSTSEPPVAIFGSKRTASIGNQLKDYEHRQLQTCREDLVEEEADQIPAEQANENVLSNGNLNESASESSSVSNLNLSQTEHADSRRLSGFMGNNRSKRFRVGGSTGDLCFSSHLETEKSLFSTKNAGAKGSGRPTFNASIYGSTSSLGSSHSSLFANSPFYNGRTTYGGASAYTNRRDTRQKALRVPVQIRPSSSLSNFSSSNVSLASDTSALSNTAKRILEIMNQCSGPLNEARKLGSSLSLNSTLASAKVPGLVQARKRFNEEDLSINRSIRMSSPRTPYSRPVSATGISSSSSNINKPPIAELLVPTTSQLLQMKRLQSNTESVRRLATESAGKTVLNQPTEYKLATDAADDSNNNVKHTSKMRNKLNRVREESQAERSNNSSVAQINLPDVQLTGLKSVPKFDIKFPGQAANSSNGTAGGKTSDAVQFGTSAKKDSSQQNNNRDSLSSGYNSSNNNSSTTIGSMSPLSSNNNNLYKFSSPTKLTVAPTVSDGKFGQKVPNHFKFSDPELLETGKGKDGSPKAANAVTKLTGIKFDPYKAKPKATAEVVPVSSSAAAVKTQPPLKVGSCLDALKSPTLAVAPAKATSSEPLAAASGFGNAFKLTGSNKWECEACMVRNNPELTKCVACETPKPGAKAAVAPLVPSKSAPPVVADVGFKALAAQQSAKWECSSCMTRNDADKTKCVCCEMAKPGAAPSVAAVKSMFSMPVTSSSSDVGFKALVAQQSANKWECTACMTRNEASRSKCACCEQAKPGSTPADAPSFSFGSQSTIGAAAEAKFSFGIPAGSSTGTEKSSVTSGGFSFGGTPVSSTSAASTSTGGFTFGAVATSSTAASSTEVKPKTIFGTSNAAVTVAEGGFSFGIPKPVTSSSDDVDSSKKQEEKKDTKVVPSFGSSTEGFTFGSKTTTDTMKKSETVTSTTVTGGFSFGTSPAAAAFKSTEAPKSTGFTFGKPAEIPASSVSTISSTSATTAITSSAVAEKKPTSTAFSSIVSSSSATAASSTPPPPTSSTFSFGTPSDSSSSNKPVAPVASGMFSFGTPKSPVQTATAKESSVATATAPAGNVPIFGGAQKAPGPSITPSFSFGAPVAGSSAASSSTIVPSTTATVAPTFSFGAAAAKPAVTNTTSSATPVSSTSATSFVFGQSNAAAKTTSGFGAQTTVSDKPTTFGGFAAATPPSSSIFGGAAAATPSSGFSFGASAASPASSKPTETSSPAFSFGGANKSSLTSNAPVFGAATASKTIFGSPAATGVSNNSTFGSFGAVGNANNSTTATFGSSTFGATSPSTTANTSGSIFGQTSVPAFGAPSGSAAGAAPTFGAAPTGFGAMTGSSNLFGVPSTTSAPTADEPQTKKPFEFGSNTTVNSQSAAPFQFGAASNNNNNNNNDNGSKPFSFSAHSAPNFNFTAGSNAGQSSAPFTFGGQNQSNAPTAPGGVFNFGGGAGLSGSAGLGGMAEPAPVVTDAAPPAFQFGAGSMTHQNPFAATSITGQSSAQQQRRKLRATRRITPR